MARKNHHEPIMLDRIRNLKSSTITIILLAFLVLFAGGMVTPLDDWYYGLEQPPWKPPDWLFGPAWTIIFALLAYAAIKAWNASQSASDRRLIAALFLTNGLLNVTWSILFFTLQRPDWALFEVGFLWLSIISIMVFIRRLSPVVLSALTPYLVWVSFAATVNASVVKMNGPFG